MTWRAVLVLALVAAVGAVSPRADVLERSENGFLVRNEATIAASPLAVYEALTGKVASWWDAAHTFSGNAASLSLDAKPGGCFCERLPDGGGVQHLQVIYAAPGKELRLHGTLGPLQTGGLAGSMVWTLTGVGVGTRVEVSYTVGGFRPGGLTSLSAPVDQVLREQLARLKRFVESGKPS